jgi:hypothetical protein
MGANVGRVPIMALSYLARAILSGLRSEPDRVRYDTRPLGGVFRPNDIVALDAAYKELHDAGLVEPADVYYSFGGNPKTLYRLSERGRAYLADAAGAER